MKVGQYIFIWCVLLTFYCVPVNATAQQNQNQECINLNTAQAGELMRLPYVGKVMAERIIEFRQKHGPFKRSQDVLIIRGMSAKRYRQIAHLICTIH
ncbi:MAG TPA: helix-hairpin-helix domain-containing protein [Blastocatellia bacterium]|nr:helix-hairpin-helix domain-containing protein [Blastocatellia bacterium]